MAEADQPLPRLVPKAKGKGLEAGEERDRLNGLKKGMRFVTAFEVIVGNSGTQMVDVVEADVTGEPLEDLGQSVEGAPLKRGGGIIPFVSAFPINSFELVLHVEKPDASGARDGCDGQLNEEVLDYAKGGAESGGHAENCKVHPVHRIAFALACVFRWEAL